MNLAIDIGNTRRKIGRFDGSRLIEQKVVTDWTTEDLLQYCNQTKVRRIILASVGVVEELLHTKIAQHFDFMELTHKTPLPFTNRYATPETLGKDRLAAVAGAQTLLPSQHCLVVDCGTCIKYDALTLSGDYLGGNIAPGLGMRAKAMHHFTARLPEVSLQMPTDFIGQSTETALQNGAFRGAILEIDGFIQLFQAQLSPLQVILTGGDATFLKPFLKAANVEIEPHLTLHGLNHILNHNSRKHPTA